MPSVKDLYPDKWLKPQHLGARRPTVAIEAVKVERLYNPRTRQEEPKIVLAFYGKQLRLPLNKTQSFRMAELTREEDYTAWVGHQVVLSVARAHNGADTIAISPVPDKPSSSNSSPAREPSGRGPAQQQHTDAQPEPSGHPDPTPAPAGQPAASTDNPFEDDEEEDAP